MKTTPFMRKSSQHVGGKEHLENPAANLMLPPETGDFPTTHSQPWAEVLRSAMTQGLEIRVMQTGGGDQTFQLWMI